MINLIKMAQAGPDISALIDEFGKSILEQRAQLVDLEIDDRLLRQLVMSYVQAEIQLRELNELKNRFLGIAAHDLRNPLTAIRGMAQLMLEMEMDDTQRKEFQQAVYQAADDMLRLVNDLLDVSVIESGKLDMRLAKGNIGDLVRSRIRLLSPVAEKKSIRIESAFDDTEDSTFDADRFAQVIDNLISNAIKFSPQGSTVRIGLGRDAGAVMFSVSDEGPGLTAEDREKLFGTFAKLSARPTGGEKSTGLGLAIVKKIVDAHHGTIDVRSKPGEGAEFIVRIPIA